MDRAHLGLTLRVCVVVAIALGAYVGLEYPRQLGGVAGWSLVVLAALFGLGGVIRRMVHVHLGLGEQLVAGTVVWIGVGGMLMLAGVASRGPLLGLATIGAAIGALEILTRSRERETPVDNKLAIVVLALGLATFLLINLLGTAGSRANPHDDQVAYVGLVKRLLDVGDLEEPFSFRRLSAYGGQTLLQALAALRGDVMAIDLLDRGIYQIIGILVVLDLMHRRQLHLGLRLGIVAFMLSLPEMHANSAALWTGFSCFVGAYAFAAREDLAPSRALGLVFAVCGAACTLRQNYLIPAGLFAAFVLASHVAARARKASWRRAIADERRTIAIALGCTAAVLVPYMIAAWKTFDTFLYPLLLGTANPTAPLRPTAGTPLDELAFLAQVTVNSEPIHIWWLLVPIMFMARDRRPNRPWIALLVAALAGFVVLVHSFTLSDSHTLWRYGFGYMTPLAVVFAIEAAARLPAIPRDDDPPVRLHATVALVAWMALLVHFVEARNWPAVRFTAAQQNLEAAIVFGTVKYDPRVASLERIQATIPEGERIAVLIDDPYMLDFSRNSIAMLDLVGFVAPWPGIPSFTTPLHWRAYLRAQGIRYLIFAEIDESTWLYRRGGWVFRIFGDDELFRYVGAHIVDAIDTLHALARESTVLFHGAGYYAIDLGALAPPEPPREDSELERMDAFVRELSIRELQNNSWQLVSRRDVVFKANLAGPSQIAPVPGLETGERGGLARFLFGSEPEPAHRWLSDRSHVRVLGDGGTYRLHVRARINTARLQARPHLSIHFAGEYVATGQPDAAGLVTLDTELTCAGWCDLYLVLSTMPEWWLPAEAMRAAQLLEFDWTRAR